MESTITAAVLPLLSMLLPPPSATQPHDAFARGAAPPPPLASGPRSAAAFSLRPLLRRRLRPSPVAPPPPSATQPHTTRSRAALRRRRHTALVRHSVRIVTREGVRPAKGSAPYTSAARE